MPGYLQAAGNASAMKTKNRTAILCTAVALSCLLMMLTDGLWQPGYVTKSAVKMMVFGVLPLLLSRWMGLTVICWLKPDKSSVMKGALLGIGTVLVILGAYALLHTYLDLSAVPQALESDTGITKNNFPFVAIYIALCNSLLEEFFFRGFACNALTAQTGKVFCAVFSSLAFALYHAGMLVTMVNPILFALALLALAGCGLFFVFLNGRSGNIWTSWLVHMGANIGINLIAMHLLRR